MILRARYVITMAGAPIQDGAVVIKNEAIKAVGTWEEIQRKHSGEVLDLGAQILMPGLINTHCHLDYTHMRSAISPQRSFTEWIRRINAVKRSTYPQDYRESIAAGFQELLKWGTTSVANIETFPELIADFGEPPVRTWWFVEMIDIRARQTHEEAFKKAASFLKQKPAATLEGIGLSPHAPYTASGDLFGLCSKYAKRKDVLITTHVAEAREEWEMFREGRGELYEFMLQLGRWMNDCKQQRTPLGHVAAHANLTRNWLLVHMNELAEEDFAFLKSLPTNNRPSIAHCPGSHQYFSHSPFPLKLLREIGINVCLATDSLASTNSLSLFDEMRTLAGHEPELSPEEIIRMATSNGAAALGMEGRLGRIVPGALADLIALPTASGVDDVYKAVLEYKKPVSWRMIHGKIL